MRARIRMGSRWTICIVSRALYTFNFASPVKLFGALYGHAFIPVAARRRDYRLFALHHFAVQLQAM
jgi:hypothetical protein